MEDNQIKVINFFKNNIVNSRGENIFDDEGKLVNKLLDNIENSMNLFLDISYGGDIYVYKEITSPIIDNLIKYIINPFQDDKIILGGKHEDTGKTIKYNFIVDKNKFRYHFFLRNLLDGVYLTNGTKRTKLTGYQLKLVEYFFKENINLNFETEMNIISYVYGDNENSATRDISIKSLIKVLNNKSKKIGLGKMFGIDSGNIINEFY